MEGKNIARREEMFVHIGDRKAVSDTKLVAILNCDTVAKSPGMNAILLQNIKGDDKTMAVCIDSIVTTRVSSYTVIKRYGQINDTVWSKKL